MTPHTCDHVLPGWLVQKQYNGTTPASLAGVGLLQPGDVEPGHVHHGPRDPGRRGEGRAGDHLEEYGRDDLPAQPVFVLEPPAGDLLAAIGQAVPVKRGCVAAAGK